MRVNAETKQATRQRILDTARKLFASKGFENTSTRDLASAAGIGAGTLFNYFPTKEAIAMTLVADVLTEAHEEFHKSAQRAESLEEDLFGYLACQLRHLKPHRAYLEPVLETALSPVASSAAAPEGESIRVMHLDAIEQLLRKHGHRQSPSFVLLHLYWTLYTGVLAFWSRDRSRHQEDTLAVLDQALKMFVRALPAPSAPSQPKAGGVS
jgi:AcrR family transcriptional regulator